MSELFTIDENNNFFISYRNGIIIDLVSIFNEIISFSLKVNEKKDFSFKDIRKINQEFSVEKIEDNLFKLQYYSSKQIIYLYKRIILKTEKQNYDIYCESQVKFISKNILQTREFFCYINGDVNKIINIKEFKKYPGKTIEIILNHQNKYNYIFERDKNKIKKLSDLTLNSKYMFEEQEENDNVFTGKGRQEFHKELKEIFDSNKFKYYCGQSGIGKTVSLLDFRYKNENILYLNMNILFKNKLNLNDFYQILKNELIFLFSNYEEYNNFINKEGQNIFLTSIGNLEFNKFGLRQIKVLIEQLIIYYENLGLNFMVIIDQYKKKYDYYYGITDFLEDYVNNNYYLKFVCCSSNNEEDVREEIYSSIFYKNKSNKKYISIKNLVDLESTNLSDKQKRILSLFGNSLKYFNKIKNCPINELDSLIEKLKKEIYDEIRNSIKKLNIENEVIYGLLMIMYNIGKEIDKVKLKSLFKFIFLKFITIEPKIKEEEHLINFWELNKDEEIFILKYSFPILKSIFKMILKEYKKKDYKQRLVDCTNAEEGYILEHLIYLSFDTGERQFVENLKIDKSYEIDQVYHFSKLFIDNYNEKNKLDTLKYVDSLLEEGKNYHLFQHNENGPKFDGALLISNIKKITDKNNKLNGINEIHLNEEDNVKNSSKLYKGKQNSKTKKRKKTFNLIIYQSPKKKRKNRIDNNFISANKKMIRQNFELLFNIKIKKINFIYIVQELCFLTNFKKIKNT